MTAPILVGMDLSNSSLIALEEALPIARRRGAEIVMVHVAPLPNTAEHYEFAGLAMVERYREMIASEVEKTREVLADVRERHSGQGVTISHTLISGVAERGISEAAEEVGAELIVVGSHGREGLDRFLLGSVAERLSRFTTRDVLVARGERPKGTYNRILVPTDFSEAADQALSVAKQLVTDNGSITLLHCFDIPATMAGYFVGNLLVEVEAAAMARAETLAKEARMPGIDIDVIVRGGHAPTLIRELSGGYDIVVMGSHGRRGLRRFMLGSVAEKIVRHAPCSVYIARAKKSEEEGGD